jgi:MFS family permease
MRASGKLLVAGSTLSQVGNYVNVTAVMVVLQAKHGSALLAAYFLLRTVAPFVLSRPLVTVVPERLAGVAWAIAQAVLASIMVVLAVGHDQVPLLLGLLAVAGVLQSSSSAWVMQIAASADPEHRDVVITAQATCSSVALVAGPALGGLLAALGGLGLVFAFDAVSFAVSMLLVPWSQVARTTLSSRHGSLRAALSSSARVLDLRHPGRHDALQNLTMLWVAFGLFGGFLTASETPIFRDLKGFGSSQIGLAIGAYGLGGLVVFLASTFFGFTSRRLLSAAVMLAASLTWLVVGGWGVYVAFFFVGLGYSLVDSAAQVAFGESFAHEPATISQSWAWVNQLSLLTSVTTFAISLGYFSATQALGPISVVVAVFAGLCVVAGVRTDKELATAAGHRLVERDGVRPAGPGAGTPGCAPREDC